MGRLGLVFVGCLVGIVFLSCWCFGLGDLWFSWVFVLLGVCCWGYEVRFWGSLGLGCLVLAFGIPGSWRVDII